jgi:predicted AAA+ superfamily ATPase
LFLKDKKFSYLNFDDERLDLNHMDTDELLSILLKNNPEYIFFDEIQNLPNWHIFVNRLLRN